MLPAPAYDPLRNLLLSRNIFYTISELQKTMKKVDGKSVGEDLLNMAAMEETLVRDICAMAEEEIERASMGGCDSWTQLASINAIVVSSDTLFRETTTFTQTTERALAFYGVTFLEASIGPVIRRMCQQKSNIETDQTLGTPGKGTGGSSKESDYHGKLLEYWAQEMWNGIYERREDCPLWVHLLLIVL